MIKLVNALLAHGWCTDIILEDRGYNCHGLWPRLKWVKSSLCAQTVLPTQVKIYVESA